MLTIPFHTTTWDNLPATIHHGETGVAMWQTLSFAGFRMRKVRLSENYKADHWCTKGHIVYCLEGSFVSELRDGTTNTLTAGMSYQVSDALSMHRSHSPRGATLLIMDGDFLKNQLANPWRM